MLTFTVIGKPEPAGSKRAFRNPKTDKLIVTDANQNAKPWQAAVRDAAVAAICEGITGGEIEELKLLDGPLALTLRFYLTRPKGHYGKKGLLPSAPEFPMVKPDALKLTRGVEDALTGVIWRDDAQIVQEEILKLYGDPARVEIEVYELNAAGSPSRRPGAGSR